MTVSPQEQFKLLEHKQLKRSKLRQARTAESRATLVSAVQISVDALLDAHRTHSPSPPSCYG